MWIGELLRTIFLSLESTFLKVLNLSIVTVWLILAVLLARFLLRRSAKWTRICLWALVALRLVLPFSFQSPTSLIPSDEPVPSAVIQTEGIVVVDSGIPAVDKTVNPALEKAEERPQKFPTTRDISRLASLTWFMGTMTMLLYCWISFLKLRRRFRTATKFEDNVYQSELIDSPFVFGLFRPKIYIPYHMDAEDMQSVLAHERAHISRRDHIIKPFAFLLLSVYWFNPLIWLAYKLFCKDIELACDEKVIRSLDESARKKYSEALLRVSICPKSVRVCPLAFGEIGVKERICRVLDYKKPTLWLIAVSVLLLVIVGACFVTAPSRRTVDPLLNTVQKTEPLAQKHLKGTPRESIIKEWGMPTAIMLESHEEVYRAFYYTEFHNQDWPTESFALLSYKNGNVKTYRKSDGFKHDENKLALYLNHSKADFDGVEVRITDTCYSGDQLNVTIQWFNGSGKQITVGDYFWIDYYSESENAWRYCTIHQKQASNLIGDEVKPGETFSNTYDFSQFNLNNYGVYRFSSNYITTESGLKTDIFFELRVAGIGSYKDPYSVSAYETPQSGYNVYWLERGTGINEEMPFTLAFVPHLQLNEKDSTFQFFYDPLSSYVNVGKYTIEGDIIMAVTEDGKYTFCFKMIDSDYLEFLGDRSSKPQWVDKTKAFPFESDARFRLDDNPY